MGKLNLLQGKWDGKVGQTVGAKWKNKATIRAYAKPSNPNTAPQQEKRTVFKAMSQFVALFADQIKSLSSLNTRGQSVRNAIIQANKDQFAAGGRFNKDTLIVNKGGLVALENVQVAAGGQTITWTPPTATNISAKATVVVVVVNSERKIGIVHTALASTGTIDASAGIVGDPSDYSVYVYMIDYRGSTRVGNNSVKVNFT